MHVVERVKICSRTIANEAAGKEGFFFLAALAKLNRCHYYISNDKDDLVALLLL